MPFVRYVLLPILWAAVLAKVFIELAAKGA
jgi:hypothetical protein